MSLSFKERVTASERLIVLQLLAQDADNAVSEYGLKQSMAAVGQAVSGGALKDHLRFLEAQYLVRLAPSLLANMGMIVQLTERGLDVANGLEPVDGVDKPRKEVF